MPHITGETPLQLWAAADGPDEKSFYGDNEDVYVLDTKPAKWRYSRVDDFGDGDATHLPPEFSTGAMTPEECVRAFRRYQEVLDPWEEAAFYRGRDHGRREIRTALAGLIGADAINMVIRGDQ